MKLTKVDNYYHQKTMAVFVLKGENSFAKFHKRISFFIELNR